jgi:hypothetical protein
VRLAGIVTEPTEFRHTLHNATIPAVAFHRIKQQGLRISQGGAQAQYGRGAYAWPAKAKMEGVPYVDLMVPAGTMIEELRVNGAAPFYRFLPATGDHIRVEVLRTNVDEDMLEQFRELAK